MQKRQLMLFKLLHVNVWIVQRMSNCGVEDYEHTDTHTHRHKRTHTDTDTQTHTHTHTDRQTDTHRHTQTHTFILKSCWTF